MARRDWLLRVVACGIALASEAALPRQASCAELTLRQVVAMLNAADAAHPVDLSGRDLSELDLSGLDLRGARLRGSNLYGVDLTDVDLSGADLHGANLNRTVIIRTRFTGADLSYVTMFLPAGYAGMDATEAEAPNFAHTNLSHARMFGHFGWADWRGADLSDVHFELGGVEFLANSWTDLTKCRLDGANLAGAVLAGVRMRFASLAGADLRGTDFRHADLSRVDMRGTELAGAKLSGADLDGADVSGARGLDKTVGLAEALDTDHLRQ